MDLVESAKTQNVPLPDNIELLSSGEILGLLKEHCKQLQSYVTKFHPQDQLKREVGELRSQLELLERKFQGLEREQSETQRELEECRILEAQYVKKWQDLRQRITEKYSDESLKRALEDQIRHWDDLSAHLEVEANGRDDLDDLLKEYTEARTQFHARREKLVTWNQQGKLRM